jgi:hypothetical protein
LQSLQTLSTRIVMMDTLNQCGQYEQDLLRVRPARLDTSCLCKFRMKAIFNF